MEPECCYQETQSVGMSSLSATRVLFFERHPFQEVVEVVCFTCAEPVNQLFDDTVNSRLQEAIKIRNLHINNRQSLEVINT